MSLLVYIMCNVVHPINCMIIVILKSRFWYAWRFASFQRSKQIGSQWYSIKHYTVKIKTHAYESENTQEQSNVQKKLLLKITGNFLNLSMKLKLQKQFISKHFIQVSRTRSATCHIFAWIYCFQWSQYSRNETFDS